jgi:signal transduction histidine kinase
MIMLKKSSILIVDDVPDNLHLLMQMLPADHYSVRPVTNGRRALEAAFHAPPDLILLDIKMPEMDGFMVCGQLKAEPKLKEIPVIFISALNETEDKLKAFDAGGVDYITKPFQQREVLARVKTHLEIRAQKSALEHSLQQQKSLEELRDSLTQMIVHDMKSPLMAIDGQLKMLQVFEAESLSPDALRYIADARTGSGRLVKMMEDMLAISKMEVGKLTLNLVPVDLRGLAQQVVAGLTPMLGSKSIVINAEDPIATMMLDQELISRVFQNLLINSLKFSPEDGLIQVNFSPLAQGVLVEVQDSGPGIAQEYQKRIFEKFGQVESALKRRGTGLGLTFCKLAIEAHGGEIGLTSAPGAGSTFWFILNTSQTSISVTATN